MDTGQAFIDQSRKYLTSYYLPRLERAVERLSDEQIWWRPNEASNSVGNLMLHLAGNIRQWMVAGVGGAADDRRRQQEFDERGPVPRPELLRHLRRALADADAVLATVSPDALGERRTIQKLDVTVLEAVYHVVEHLSMHAGQIIYIAKMHTGDLGFYDLSGGKPRPTWH